MMPGLSKYAFADTGTALVCPARIRGRRVPMLYYPVVYHNVCGHRSEGRAMYVTNSLIHDLRFSSWQRCQSRVAG